MALQQTVIATTTHEVKLKPTLKRKLLTELRTYAEIKSEIAVLEAALAKHKATITELQQETGEKSIAVEGFKVTEVTNIRSTLDTKKLVALGVTTAQIQEATVTKPGRPYTKITVPGEKDREED